MRVGTRLAAGFLALIFLFGAILLFYHGVVDRSVATASQLADVDNRLLLGATGQLDRIAELEENAEKFIITGDMGYFDRYRAVRRAIADSLAAFEALPVAGSPLEALSELSGRWRDFEDRFPLGEDDVASARALAGLDGPGWTEFERNLALIESGTERLRLNSIGSVGLRVDALSGEAGRARRTGWLALAGALLLGGILALLMVRSITRPLGRIEKGTAALAQGDFASRVEVSGQKEFIALAERFNEMADRLGELDRAKRDFLAHVSHDLKTPLASIRETQRVLLDGAPGELNAKQRRLTELGLSNAERLATMISRILELSRLEAGVEDYAFDTVDLSDICAETVTYFAPETGGPPVSFAGVEISAPVRGDRDALRRVLENLLDNARSYGRGQPIEVELSVAGGRRRERAVVNVRDRGPGVPESERESIFRSFAQRRDGDGANGHVGLGLAICREILRAHGGEIWVESARGGGSIFGFSLPVTSKRVEPASPVEVSSAESPTGRKPAVVSALGLLCLTLWGCASGRPEPPQITLPAHAELTLSSVEPLPVPERIPTPHPFDVLFDAGAWEEAAAIFEADSSLHDSEIALYRSGLIHAMPEASTFDPARSRARFTRLLELFPESRYRAVSEVVLGLVGRLGESSAALAVLRQQLDRLKAVDLKEPPP